MYFAPQTLKPGYGPGHNFKGILFYLGCSNRR